MIDWRIDNDCFLMNVHGDPSISDYDRIYIVYEIAGLWNAYFVQYNCKPWPNNFYKEELGEFTNSKFAKTFCEIHANGQITLF